MCLEPASRKVYASRDVVFNEEDFTINQKYFWDRKENEQSNRGGYRLQHDNPVKEIELEVMEPDNTVLVNPTDSGDSVNDTNSSEPNIQLNDIHVGNQFLMESIQHFLIQYPKVVIVMKK